MVRRGIRVCFLFGFVPFAVGRGAVVSTNDTCKQKIALRTFPTSLLFNPPPTRTQEEPATFIENPTELARSHSNVIAVYRTALQENYADPDDVSDMLSDAQLINVHEVKQSFFFFFF